jgi:putative flippase GtrA
VRFPRYVVAGGINSAATYVLYLLLLRFTPYLWAYSLSYVAGIGIGYLLNAYWVFGHAPTARTALAYPLVYVLGYAAGATGVALGVEVLRLPAALAPFLGVAMSVPITYLAASRVFTKKEQK